MMNVSSPRYRTRSLSRAGSQPPALKPSVPSNNDQQNTLQPMHRPDNGESSIHAVDTRLTPSRHSPSVAPKSPSDCSNMSPWNLRSLQPMSSCRNIHQFNPQCRLLSSLLLRTLFVLYSPGEPQIFPTISGRRFSIISAHGKAASSASFKRALAELQ